MIQIVVEDAEVSQCGAYDPRTKTTGWACVHPSNGAILAYCDTEAEAIAVREAINDLARQLRATGKEVR